MDNPRVLLASPVNMIKYYILFDWLDHLASLTYDNFGIFLVDNTETPAFYKGLRNLGYDTYWVDPAGKEIRQYMAESNEVMRKKALIEDYDFLFILECDIFTPREVIERLLSHDYPVVGAAYWTGHGTQTRMQLTKLTQINNELAINTDLTLAEAMYFMDGNCKPIFASGNGCILIHQSVLEQIKFHIVPGEKGFADAYFHQDIYQMGIMNYVDTSIDLIHYNHDWNIVPDFITKS